MILSKTTDIEYTIYVFCSFSSNPPNIIPANVPSFVRLSHRANFVCILRAVVEVNLNTGCFTPGKPAYERLKESFVRLSHQGKFVFCLNTTQTNEGMCIWTKSLPSCLSITLSIARCVSVYACMHITGCPSPRLFQVSLGFLWWFLHCFTLFPRVDNKGCGHKQVHLH